MATYMMPPEGAAAFLAAHGWEGAAIHPLAGDASFRRYFRVERPVTGETAVLMDAPPPHEDPRPFLAIADHLHGLGLSVPRAAAADLEQGLVLLEDFGDHRLTPLLEREPEREETLYEAAIDVLAHLGRHAPPAALAPYDAQEYLREVRLFAEWYMPVTGLHAEMDTFEAAWLEALGPVLRAVPSVLGLRDYHADNLMLLEGRAGVRGLGLLDFQDARAGHPAYDLVSLLEDARRDVPERLQRVLFDRFAAASGADPELLGAAFAILGAQRNAKILGIFTRLWRRDGKPRYLAFQPRVWAHLERDLAHPALAPVRAWFDRHVPDAARAGHWANAA